MTAPIRIERKGFRKLFPATRKEIKKAAVFAEFEAKGHGVFVDPDALMRFLCWSVGEQLGCNVDGEFAAWHGEHDEPLIEFTVGQMIHFVAVRDVKLAPALPLDAATGASAVARVMARTASPAPDVKQAVEQLAAKVNATPAQPPKPATPPPPPQTPPKTGRR